MKTAASREELLLEPAGKNYECVSTCQGPGGLRLTLSSKQRQESVWAVFILPKPDSVPSLIKRSIKGNELINTSMDAALPLKAYKSQFGMSLLRSSPL